MDKNEVWSAVLKRISEKISRMEFCTWFKKVQLHEISGGAVLIKCPTEMNKNWLENKYYSIILANIQSLLPEIDRIFLQVDLSLSDGPVQNPEVFETPKPRKLPNKPEIRLEEGLESRLILSLIHI